jgi:guanylate kinase
LNREQTPQFPAHIPLVLIVSGPAGAGKTSLVNSLVANSDQFIRAITCTTRPPRRGEINGVDYHFLSPEDYRRRLDAGDFIEHAQVYGKLYGTPKQNITIAFEQQKDLVINIDVQGASTIRQRAKEVKLKDLGCSRAGSAMLAEIVVSVFLMPVSISQLQDRLRGRGTDDAETIQRRLDAVPQEMERWPEYDYVIVSGPLAEDLRQLQAIIAAERLRTKRLVTLV